MAALGRAQLAQSNSGGVSGVWHFDRLLGLSSGLLNDLVGQLVCIAGALTCSGRHAPIVAHVNQDATMREIETRPLPIRRLIKTHPFRKEYALHAPLGDMYRFIKGRVRIMWFAVPTSREVLVIFISNTPCPEAGEAERLAMMKVLADGGFLSVLEEYRRATSVPRNAPLH